MFSSHLFPLRLSSASSLGQGELRMSLGHGITSQGHGIASSFPLQPRHGWPVWQPIGHGRQLPCKGAAAEPYSSQSICVFSFELFPASNYQAFPLFPPRFGARAVSLVAGSWCLSSNPAWAKAAGCRWAVRDSGRQHVQPTHATCWGPSEIPSATLRSWCCSSEPKAAQCLGQWRWQQRASKQSWDMGQPRSAPSWQRCL